MKSVWQLLAGIILLLAFNQSAWAHPLYDNQSSLVTEDHELPAFSGIYINGPLNVKIISNPCAVCPPSIHVIADPRTMSYVRTRINRKGILSIRLPSPPYYGKRRSRITVIVHCGYLNYLNIERSCRVVATGLSGTLSVTANGNGNITLLGNEIDLRCLNVGGRACVFIQGINSALLNIQDASAGSVNLQGFMMLHCLTYSGRGLLRAYWINSSYVRVMGCGTGRISLGGVAGLLEATLSNATHLNARFLRASRAVINTRGISKADVWSETALYTLATDRSNIYSHNNSGNLWYHMRPPGAVLRMTRIDSHKFPTPPHPCFTNDYYQACDSYEVDCF
jgi:Putative auto-transporter adhesin, head GIN domain